MNNLSIMVDVDSTLYDPMPIFKKAAVEFGFEWPVDTGFWLTPEYLKIEKRVLDQMFDKCHGREFAMSAEPYECAVEQLTQILTAHNWLDINYVSNRNPRLQHVLVDWLEMYGFPKPENAHAVISKNNWISENHPIIVVDDRVRTILHAWQLQIGVFSLEHPWNINLRNEVQGVWLAKDWRELGDKIFNYVGNFKINTLQGQR